MITPCKACPHSSDRASLRKAKLGTAHPAGGPSAAVGGAAAAAPPRQGPPLAGAHRAAGPPTAARLGPPDALATLWLPAGVPKPWGGP